MAKAPDNLVKKPADCFLKKHADYQRAYSAAVKGRTRLAGWFAAARPEGDGVQAGIRVGLTVPKALGKAVERNRIKRRTREAVRLALSAEMTAVCADVILHPRRTVLDCEWEVLTADCAKALREALAAVKKRRDLADQTAGAKSEEAKA